MWYSGGYSSFVKIILKYHKLVIFPSSVSRNVTIHSSLQSLTEMISAEIVVRSRTGFAEVSVHRGEPDIGDIVEITQVRHHGFADGLGGDFVLAEIFEVAHDLGYGLLDPFRVDIALAERDHHRTRELVAVERHPPSVA